MAKMTITIEDTGTGVHLTIASDPPFPGPANEDQTTTNAQQIGFVAMNAISEVCGDEDDDFDEEED